MNLNRRKTLQTAALTVGGAYIGFGNILSRANAQPSFLPIENLDTGQQDKIRALLRLDDVVQLNVLKRFNIGTSDYIVIEISEAESADPVVVRLPVNGEPVILSDFEGIPDIPLNESAADAQIFNLAAFRLDENDLRITTKFGPVIEAASSSLDKLVLASAEKAADSNNPLITKNAPGTNGGRLACAYAVNAVVQKALKAPVGGGLATANMIKVLKARHVRVRTPVPGCIVISPTVYAPATNIGHVGIVGESGSIYSNSSSQGKFMQNFTVNKWESYYRDKKGLSVYYFRLDDEYFPPIG